MSTECMLKEYKSSKYSNADYCLHDIKICDYCGISICWMHYTEFIGTREKKLYVSCDRCVADAKSIMVGDQVISPCDYMARVQIQRCIAIYNTIFTKAARK